MKKIDYRRIAAVVAVAGLGLGFTACSGGSDDAEAGGTTTANEWFDQAQYDREAEEKDADFEGPADQPYLQYLPTDDMVDTSAYKLDKPAKVCFSNASVSNTWRQTGWTTMQQQDKVLQDAGIFGEVEYRDAQDNEDTQISDLDYFLSEGGCDIFLVAPTTSDALTPAVERLCETGKPVVVFDRAVNTDCPTTFIRPVGGYAWAMDSAGWLADQLEEGDKVIAIRTLAGVDAFEYRWAAAQHIFEEKGIETVDYLTGADPAEIKKAVSDELLKGNIDGVWVDLGDNAVPAVEAFEDAGQDVPPITGEDNLAFLRAWQEKDLNAIAPTWPAYIWRTAPLAASMILQGEQVPKVWTLPMAPITEDQLDDYVTANEGMPDGHAATFGGEDLPGYPEAWQ